MYFPCQSPSDGITLSLYLTFAFLRRLTIFFIVISKRIDVKKLASMANLAKATLLASGGKGTQGKEKLAKKAKGIPDAPLEVFPQK